VTDENRNWTASQVWSILRDGVSNISPQPSTTYIVSPNDISRKEETEYLRI
jgi:hypothetical protein